MNELKMQVRYEDELENKIKIVKTTANKLILKLY